MGNLWLKFSCFILGVKYKTLLSCDQKSINKVHRNMSAMLLVMALWAVTGYCLCNQYMFKDKVIPSIITAIISILLVTFLERTILLGDGNLANKIYRVLVSVIISFLGAIIIDQAFFSEDIKLMKLKTLNEKAEVNAKKTVSKIDVMISSKEIEKSKLTSENISFNKIYSKHPFIKQADNSYVLDTINYRAKTIKYRGKDSVIMRPVTRKVYNKGGSVDKPNPIKEDIDRNNERIKTLISQIDILQVKKDDAIEKSKEVSKELNGILDEILLLKRIIKEDKTNSALSVWLLFFSLCLLVEMGVLITHWTNKTTLYDKMIAHEEKEKIKALVNLNGNNDSMYPY